MDLTSVTETGFYIALVDQSTCIIVHHILVFYYVCPAETSDLITRPETIAPESTICGQCIENSSPTSSDQPLLFCGEMRTWEVIIGGCACNPGFQGVIEDGVVTNCSGTCIRMYMCTCAVAGSIICITRPHTNHLHFISLPLSFTCTCMSLRVQSVQLEPTLVTVPASHVQVTVRLLRLD